ncbi:MAG: DTW domain-containing protein [Bdellovibrionales bacterium]|nr:DTW domain-containing protein [Oligoflexia bacterium]
MFEIPLPILILQHPQEPSRQDNEVSSALLLAETLSPVHIATGLSWKSLEQATRQFEAIAEIEELKKPALWHTLYLGTKKQGQVEETTDPGIYYLDKKGNPTHPEDRPEIGGLILLDGTWAQAKTLWWRNAWLLKTRRIYIVPKTKSLYGKIRKEPRPECVSTLEAAAETLSFLGIDPEIEISLKQAFQMRLKNKRNPTLH